MPDYTGTMSLASSRMERNEEKGDNKASTPKATRAKDGGLRLRQPLLGVPPLASAVPDYEFSAWFAVSAPKATPPATITTLNKTINASIAEPAIVARMTELGSAPMVLSPAELDAFVVAETDKWAKVVKFSGVQVD
jgi:tripartite-type tricarboxylate transporter receptor subunit TctC